MGNKTLMTILWWFLMALIFSLVVYGITMGIIYLPLGDNEGRLEYNSVEVGDSFVVHIDFDDPFEEPLTLEGTIIDKRGEYVQYIGHRGDTSSTNLRLHMRYSEVQIIKKDKP